MSSERCWHVVLSLVICMDLETFVHFYRSFSEVATAKSMYQRPFSMLSHKIYYVCMYIPKCTVVCTDKYGSNEIC
jgi:hypothetical protein